MHAGRRHPDHNGVVACEHEVDNDDLRYGDEMLIEVHTILARIPEVGDPPGASVAEPEAWPVRAALGAVTGASHQAHNLVGFDCSRDADANESEDAGHVPVG